MSVVTRARPAFSIPGKVFLLGEYSVLAGQPAILAAVGPRFKMTVLPLRAVSEGLESKSNRISAKGTPLWKLQEWSRSKGASRLNFEWEDPYEEKGGFGASSAGFALGYAAYGFAGKKLADWRAAHKLYLKLSRKDAGIPPSGVDLISQWVGGVIYYNPSAQESDDLISLSDGLDWSSVLVFSATDIEGRKVATHTHLKELGTEFLKEKSQLMVDLGVLTRKAHRAVIDRDLHGLGFAMTQYAEFLAREGLESQAAREDRLQLSRIPGVAGVKGTGALLSDGLVVVLKPECREEGHVAEIVEAAESRNLRLIENGLRVQEGLRSES